jgi:hypothetical protein
MFIPLFLIILIAVIVGGLNSGDIGSRLWLTALIGLVLLGTQYLFFYSWPIIAARRITGFRNVRQSGRFASKHPKHVFACLIPLAAIYLIRLAIGGGVHPALSILQTAIGGLAMLVTVVLQTIAFHTLHESHAPHETEQDDD